MRISRNVVSIAVGLSVVGLLIWSFLPKPVLVGLAEVTQGPMATTVTGEGITRVRETWTVVAPATGSVVRSPVQVGDKVEKDVTVVAVIEPALPPILDARSRRLAEVAVEEASASVRLAEAHLERAEAVLGHAQAELERFRALADRNTVSKSTLEEAEQSLVFAQTERDVAFFALEQARATKERMDVQLETPSELSSEKDGCCLTVLAPQSGTVLSIADENARLVQAGTPLLTIGDLSDLEVEADFLSTDAISISVGASALIEEWGGAGRIEAGVRRIDPSAFSKISALGISEQRVRVWLDMNTPVEEEGMLGDQYRVIANIVTWSADDVLQIPTSALFRNDKEWAVFLLIQGRAELRQIEVGHITDTAAEVLSGLEAQECVVTYPSSEIANGTRLEPRSGSALSPACR